MAVYNEKGEKVATIENPKSPEGQKVAEKLGDDFTIDYGENNVTDAPKMRENYQLGGLIPGQPGFGQRPIPRPPVVPSSPVAPILPRPSVPPISPIMEEGGKIDEYQEGGEVTLTKKGQKKSKIKAAKEEFRERKAVLDVAKEERKRTSFFGDASPKSKPSAEFEYEWSTAGGGSDMWDRAMRMEEGYEKERRLVGSSVKRSNRQPTRKELRELKRLARKEKREKIRTAKGK